LPVEVLTKEEMERILEARVSALLEKISNLELAVAELKAKSSTSSEKAVIQRVAESKSLFEILNADLATHLSLVDIREERNLVSVRPRRYLPTPDFRAVGDIIGKHGGAWSPDRRAFLVWKKR